LVGDTQALIRAALNVEQFESGVFVGVRHSLEQPAFRTGGLWTEDEDAADLGDAIVEVRAFAGRTARRHQRPRAAQRRRCCDIVWKR
jgi:hypothetical protein